MLHRFCLIHLRLVVDDSKDEKSKWFSNNKSSASGCCLVFAWFLPISAGVAYESVAYKKSLCIFWKLIKFALTWYAFHFEDSLFKFKKHLHGNLLFIFSRKNNSPQLYFFVICVCTCSIFLSLKTPAHFLVLLLFL